MASDNREIYSEPSVWARVAIASYLLGIVFVVVALVVAAVGVWPRSEEDSIAGSALAIVFALAVAAFLPWVSSQALQQFRSIPVARITRDESGAETFSWLPAFPWRRKLRLGSVGGVLLSATPLYDEGPYFDNGLPHKWIALSEGRATRAWNFSSVPVDHRDHWRMDEPSE